MNALKKTLAMIAILILVSQTVRHAYILWVEPKGSALDKYDQPLKGEISEAASLSVLLQRYDQVHKDVELAKKQSTEAGEDVTHTTNVDREPFVSERALREAITDWESKSKEIRGLRFYWSLGFLFFILGAFSYVKFNRWLGLTLVITAFAEFIYWTSPTFWGSNTQEFDRLLLNKFVFSLMSLVLLITTILLMRAFSEERQA